jgi:hypothetical protein
LTYKGSDLKSYFYYIVFTFCGLIWPVFSSKAAIDGISSFFWHAQASSGESSVGQDSPLFAAPLYMAPAKSNSIKEMKLVRFAFDQKFLLLNV